MKIDPYKNKERYSKWKESTKLEIKGLSKTNSKIIMSYLNDMEMGLNVAKDSKKGSRSYIRLNSLRNRLIFLSKHFQERFDLNEITQIKEEQIHSFFSDMNNGKIKKKDGQIYKSTADYVKDFKSFWHWHMKVNRKNGDKIEDITTDLDTKKEKPRWVYLTEEQVKKLYDNAKYEYKVLIMFLYDTGIRSPTELINIKVSDLYNNCKEFNIRDEISKTFGRKIKLMLCSNLLKEYIKDKKLGSSDHLFFINPSVVNRYLKRLGERVLGDVNSLAGQKYSELTMYDFRHCSCCYWLPRYKSESALKYRFGWKKSEKVHYYSELLGMKDTINDEDLFIDTTKTEIEKGQIRLEKENELLKDKINSMEEQMKTILEMISGMCERVGG
ncbi:MAG: tyrosine-type recombinase/integrase [archaeon]